MTDKPIGVGIAGLGNISDVHAQAVTQSDKGRLVSACSSSKDKVREFSDKHRIKGYTSYSEFLSHPDLDLVSVCTPTGTHLNFAETAAEAGKHIVVEKPVEVSLDRAKRLIDCCRSNDVKLAVIYQSRFTEDAINMKNALKRGDIGDIFMVNASVKWYRDQEYYTSAPWRGTLLLDGGGAVINQSIHTIDLLQWMLGDADTIHAFKGTFTHGAIEGEDNAVASFRLDSGIIGTFAASTSVTPPLPRKIEIHGSRGTAILDDSTFRLTNTDTDTSSGKARPAEAASGSASPLANFKAEAHTNQFNEIFEAVLSDREPPVTGKDSLKSLAFVTALYQSAKNGQPVSVRELLNQ